MKTETRQIPRLFYFILFYTVTGTQLLNLNVSIYFSVTLTVLRMYLFIYILVSLTTYPVSSKFFLQIQEEYFYPEIEQILSTVYRKFKLEEYSLYSRGSCISILYCTV
jgi:hypothetical protein